MALSSVVVARRISDVKTEKRRRTLGSGHALIETVPALNEARATSGVGHHAPTNRASDASTKQHFSGLSIQSDQITVQLPVKTTSAPVAVTASMRSIVFHVTYSRP
jgi:hypothetical protein